MLRSAGGWNLRTGSQLCPACCTGTPRARETLTAARPPAGSKHSECPHRAGLVLLFGETEAEKRAVFHQPCTSCGGEPAFEEFHQGGCCPSRHRGSTSA